MRELDMLIRHGNIAVAKSASDLSHHENRVADIFKQMRANTKIEAAPSNIIPQRRVMNVALNHVRTIDGKQVEGQQGRVNLCRPAHPPRWAAGSGFFHRSTWETKHEQTKQVQTIRTDPIDARPSCGESARARAKAKAEDGEDSNRVSRIGDRNHRRFNCVVVAPLTGPFRPGASAAAPLPEQSSL